MKTINTKFHDSNLGKIQNSKNSNKKLRILKRESIKKI